MNTALAIFTDVWFVVFATFNIIGFIFWMLGLYYKDYQTVRISVYMILGSIALPLVVCWAIGYAVIHFVAWVARGTYAAFNEGD